MRAPDRGLELVCATHPGNAGPDDDDLGHRTNLLACIFGGSSARPRDLDQVRLYFLFF
jgi:hypothetical protein